MFDFLFLKKSIQSMRDTMGQLSNDLESVKLEIHKITHAPANKKDIAVVVENWVKQTGEGFAGGLIDRIQKNYAGGQSHTLALGFFELGRDPNESTTVGVLDVAMCAVFGEQIKSAMLSTIASMDWPNEGLPAAERAAEISRLESKAQKLRSQIKELRDQANAVDFDL